MLDVQTEVQPSAESTCSSAFDKIIRIESMQIWHIKIEHYHIIRTYNLNDCNYNRYKLMSNKSEQYKLIKCNDDKYKMMIVKPNIPVVPSSWQIQ